MQGPIGSDLPPIPPSSPTTLGVKVRLVAAAAALGAVVAGALGVFGSTTSRLLDPVALAATRSSEAPGYKVRIAMQLGTPAGPATALAHGVVDTRDHAVSMSMGMTFPSSPQLVQRLGSDTLRLNMILSGSTMYMKLPGALTGQLAAVGKRWISFDLAKAGIPSTSALYSNPMSNDPAQMLIYLRSISDSVVAEGRATVDGFATKHYRATLDLGKVLAALPSEDQAAAQRALSEMGQQLGIETIPVDVWVDSNHLVRRVQESLIGTGAGGQGFSETMTEDISDYGPQRQPSPPPAGQVASLGTLPGLSG